MEKRFVVRKQDASDSGNFEIKLLKARRLGSERLIVMSSINCFIFLLFSSKVLHGQGPWNNWEAHEAPSLSSDD